MAKQPGYALYPGSGAADELIYANALLPLSELPGQFADTMYKQRLMALKEAEYLEERRKTKRDEFLEYVEASGGDPSLAGRPSGGGGGGRATGGGGGGRPRVVASPGGAPVVAGMEFGPGSTVSADDLTLEMFTRTDQELAEELESDRAAIRGLAQTEREYAEAKGLARGAPATAEERAQALISEYGMLPAPSESEGLAAYTSGVSPEAGELAEGIPEDMRGVPFVRPDTTYAGATTGPSGGMAYEAMLAESVAGPDDVFRDAAGTFISPRAGALLVTSEIARDSLVEGLAVGKPADLIARHRVFIDFMRRRGRSKDADELEETAKVAWAQEARERKTFIDAMIPELRAIGVANPESLAALYWEDPAQAAAISKEAALMMRQVEANKPRLQEERNKVNFAKQAGKARRASEMRGAEEDLDGRSAAVLSEISEARGSAEQDIQNYESAYDEIISASNLGDGRNMDLFFQHRIRSFAEGYPVPGNLKGEVLSGRDREVRDVVIAALAESPEVFGLTAEQVGRVTTAKGLALRAGEHLDDLYEAEQVVRLETDAARRGERPETLQVRARKAGPWGATSSEPGPSATVRGTAGGYVVPVDVGGQGDLLIGGSEFLDIPGYLSRVEGAETAEVITAAAHYTGRPDPLDPPRTSARRPPVTPYPSDGQISQLAAHYSVGGLSRQEADATARATAADPDKFWAEMRKFGKPPTAGSQVAPPLRQESGGAMDTSVYDEPYKVDAYNAGARLDSGGQWRSKRGSLLTDEAVRANHGG